MLDHVVVHVRPVLVAHFLFFERNCLFFPEASFGFFVGFSSHLILDSLTIRGVSLFFPFSRKKFSGIIKTGGISETIIFVIFLIADLGLLLSKFPIF